MGRLSSFKNIVRAFEAIDRDNLGTMAPGLKLGEMFRKPIKRRR